jgi:hypothetical protein
MAGKPDSMIDSISCLQKPVPSEFAILVKELEKHRANGVRCPLRSTVAVELMKRDALGYRKAGVHTFKDYVALAVQAKIVTVGGGMGAEWISLSAGENSTSTCNGKRFCALAIPQKFQMLVKQLLQSRSKGAVKPLRSAVGQVLLDHSKSVYKDAGFEGFVDYTTAAAEAGVVQLGGAGGKAWISLCSGFE